MHCNQLTEEQGKDFRQWPDTERITVSSLKEWQIENYKAGTFSIKYVLKGTEHYFIQGKRYSVSGGNFLIVNAGQSLDVEIKSSKKVNCFCIHMTPQWMNSIFATENLTTAQMLDDPVKEMAAGSFRELIYKDTENALGTYLKRMAASYKPDASKIDLDQKELYWELAARALQLKYPDGPYKGLEAVKNSTQQELLKRLLRAREIMDSDFSTDLSLEVIAREAMLSTSHLFSCFRKVYGISPYQYLLDKRLAHAAILLTKENDTLTSIAEWCGYADGSSFTKAFKKKFGITPSAYRVHANPTLAMLR